MTAVVQRLLLQRQGAAEDEYLAAVDRSDWHTAVAYLATQSAGEVEGNVASLILSQVEAMLGAVGPDQHTIRGALLERGFGITKGSNWEKAARFVSVLDDAGIARNVAPLSPKDAKLLAKGARNTPGGGDERLLKAIRDKLRVEPGQLFGKISVTMTPHDGRRTNVTVPYRVTTVITFEPDPDVVTADLIGFVQTVSMLRLRTTDSVDNRKGMSDRLNRKGQGVDRDRGFTSGWYGEQNDGNYGGQRGEHGVTPGWVRNGQPATASMADTPDGTTPEAEYRYEATIVAKDGADKGLTYGVVHWWFTSDDKLGIATHGYKTADRPTADFGTAVAAWNAQAADDPAVKGQKALPAQRLVATDTDRPPVGGATRQVQRSPTHQVVPEGPDRLHVQRDPANDQPLRDIQGLAMHALLPALAALPAPVRTDRTAAIGIGGPRLVTAMAVVAAKGRAWLDVVAELSGELSGWPPDQVSDVMTFLGAPKGAAVYPGADFGGRFDGVVDPTGVIRLVMRVKFVFGDGLRFGPSPAGTPAWEKETAEGMARFAPDFKRVVEAAWSGKGTVKPACAIGGVREFRTDVRVQVVESGEHIRFDVLPKSGGRDFVGAKGGHGGLAPDANEPGTPEKRLVSDDTGKRPVEVENTQVPSVHEFGHAMGLRHMRPSAGSTDPAYGATVTERQDVMGAGGKVQVIRRGDEVKHDDMEPWEAIGTRWGKDVFKGPLGATCNKWTGNAS